jgi:hypothetical protein
MIRGRLSRASGYGLAGALFSRIAAAARAPILAAGNGQPIGRSLAGFLLALFLSLTPPVAAADVVDKSDMNNDGAVDTLDLEIFADTYLEQNWLLVDWCNFYTSSLSNEKYFRRITKDNTESYGQVFDFIALAYGCEPVGPTEDKSDLNGDGVVDLADLVIFSEIYLETYWQSVDWCAFHAATLAGEDFEGRSTGYFLYHFGLLLEFINGYFYCDGPPPPPPALQLENAPKYLTRITSAGPSSEDFYITDGLVGSIFVYDADLAPKLEIKGLNRPLGIAVDAEGNILVGNDGRDNIEVYDPATGDLVAVFGEGIVKMPTAITLDGLGNIYVTDSRSNHVQVFDAAYQPVRTIGKSGVGRDTLKFPIDAEIVYSSGNGQEIFIADQGNDRIQVYDLQGNYRRSLTFEGTAGQNCNWFTGLCEIPGAPPFTRLEALDVDAYGRLHVLDSFEAAVTIFDPADHTFLGVYGEYGTGAGFLTVPMDLVTTEANVSLVIADTSDRIELFDIQ